MSESDILEVDITLSQLLVSEDGELMEQSDDDDGKRQFIHPSSIESALSLVCRISPSPTGGLSLANAPASHRSRDDIAALAQESKFPSIPMGKHSRWLEHNTSSDHHKFVQPPGIHKALHND